jgi:hypothetical protein
VRDSWRTLKASPLRSLAAVLVVALLCMPLRVRAARANDDTPSACGTIYEQQMQSARFLATAFPRDRVAVNDIGAVAWMRDDAVPIVDLAGLASPDVAKAKGMRLERPPSAADIERLTAGAKVAIIYEEWFGAGLPSSWLRVGRWRIDNNRSAAFPSVSIFATDPATYPDVIEALRRFAPELPPGVHQSGRYTERPTERDRIRFNDNVVIDSDVRGLSSSYLVAEEGTIWLPSTGPVLVRNMTVDEAKVRIQRALDETTDPDDTPARVHGAKVARVARVATSRPSAWLAGRIAHPIQVEATTLDDALASALTPTAGRDPFYVWRERADGFVRLDDAGLEGGRLVDGDIVVLP